MTSVLFEDQGFEDRLPFVGVTVATVKQRLRESCNIPYFSDAIVNGEVVTVAYILRGGDRLRFQKRYGVKGGDDRPSEEREAEGLIDAYGLGEIAAEVKRLNLSKDESIDLMVVIGKWAERNFGVPDRQAEKILSEILKRLDAIEARMAFPNPEHSHDAVGSTNQRVMQSKRPRLRVDEAESVVIIDDHRYVMDRRYVAVIDCLLNANGAWLSGAEISRQKSCLEFDDRLDRLIGKLQVECPKVGKYIEAVRGRGFRLILT